MNDAPSIHVDGLTKRFGKLTAVDDLTLQVWPGEVYGLLGPNGAGKSTSIRALMGFINPTSGRVGLLGGHARELEIRRQAGYVGDVTLDRGLRAGTLLSWYAGLRGGVPENRITELCSRLELDTSRKIGQLSTGNRQKVSIIQAFMHDPDVLILDEPTAGLDPLLQRTVLRMVRERRDAGTSVLYSSHTLPEVEAIADRVGILRAGALVREDTMANIRDVARQRLELRFAGDVPADVLRDAEGVATVDADGRTAHVVVDGSAADLIDRLAGLGVERITSHDDDLEDIFFEYYQDEQDSESNRDHTHEDQGVAR
ncbi:ABC transporter ATP-binding protein [Phytoactinopolyspora halotolerans]|uniref:ABC transporter ATP-binding protein n=1 Tax=Phytoactinopolyspora halotolerans TaxID=1981512 RepID=A0A6L9S620_9ACTN|nr:ABC transporter ATP-binding protein [Phytoactinopolyspora halotolerans]NED99961.1 ABC transporter ATP-binding protein [Phytoactinopolyspora halotolerans]